MKVDLKCSMSNKLYLYEVMDVLTNLSVIILQHTCESNHQVLHLKLSQCCMLIMSQ